MLVIVENNQYTVKENIMEELKNVQTEEVTEEKMTMKDAAIDALGFGAMVWVVLYGLGAFLCALGAALPAILIIWLIITGFFGS